MNAFGGRSAVQLQLAAAQHVRYGGSVAAGLSEDSLSGVSIGHDAVHQRYAGR